MHGACILGLHRYANDAWGMHPRTPPVCKRCMGHAPSDSTGTAPLRTSIKARTACRRASSFPLQISAPGRTRRATAGLRLEEEPPMEHLSQYDSDVEGEVEVHHVTAVLRQALPAVRVEPLVPRARVREPTTPGFVIPVTNRVRRLEAEPAAPKKSRKKKKVRWAKAIEASKPPTPVEETPDRNLSNMPEGRARTAGDYFPSDEPMAVEAAAPPVDKPMAEAQSLNEFFEERPLFDEDTRAKLRWSPPEEPPLDELRQLHEEGCSSYTGGRGHGDAFRPRTDLHRNRCIPSGLS